MISEIGHVALILSLIIALIQGTVPMLGAARSDGRLMAVGTTGALLQWVFITIAFLNVLDGSDLIRMIMLQWSFKVLYEVIATPLTYAIVGFLKRKEDMDIYDKETSFNPIQLP